MSEGEEIAALRALKLVEPADVARMAVAPTLASSSASVGEQARPRAYTGPYPIRSHRTLAEVWGG